LGERGKEGVELFLGEADDVSSGVLSELFKVELSSGAKGFEGGCGSRWGWRSDDVWVGIDGGGLKGVGVDEGNAGVLRSKGLKDATCVGWFGDDWDCSVGSPPEAMGHVSSAVPIGYAV